MLVYKTYISLTKDVTVIILINYYSTICNTMVKKKGGKSQLFETTTGQNDLVSCKLNGTENFHMT